MFDVNSFEVRNLSDLDKVRVYINSGETTGTGLEMTTDAALQFAADIQEAARRNTSLGKRVVGPPKDFA